MVKWLHVYWLVILVSCVLSIAINQALSQWTRARERGSGERAARNRVLRTLLADLRGHCEYLQSLLLNPSIDTERWQRVNDALQTAARKDGMEAALGERFNPYLWALAAEARAIISQRRPGQDAAATIENVADVLIAYAPLIRTLGDGRSAREFESAARKSYDYAKTVRTSGSSLATNRADMGTD